MVAIVRQPTVPICRARVRDLRIGCVPDLPVQRLLSFLGALYACDQGLDAETVHLGSGDLLRRLRIGELDLCLTPCARDRREIELEPLFPGELLAAFLPAGHRLGDRPILAPGDLKGEILLIAPPADDPALHGQLMALLDGAGYRFRGVRETGGAHRRDVLLAVAEGRGITLGQASALRTVGELGTLVTCHLMEPPQRMPDTAVAWLARPTSRVGPLLACIRDVARDLYGSTAAP
jgi:LysR substrate binding domain